MLNKYVANVLEQAIVEHRDDVFGTLFEVVKERAGKAEAVSLPLVVGRADENVRETLIVSV